jgi:peptidoglycan/xylan/chitin deacetylase (PgdA/CDA1 family)
MQESALWPDGKRFAAAFTFDFDAEEGIIAEDPANADRPGILSQGTYDAKVAVPWILELLEAKGVMATFFIPGRVAERHPARVQEIVGAGHEIAHHGYTHTSPTLLSRDEEENEIAKGLEVLRSFGTEVIGYRSPAWDFSANTEELLQQHGFVYSSNFMDDLKPYRRERSDLIELPIQWTLDDAAHFWFDAESWNKKISTADEVRQIWEGELRGYRQRGGAFILTMHPQIIGRPYRMELLEGFIEHVLAMPDAWVATCREIAARVS